MNNNSIPSFEERVKDAPTMGFFMNRYFSQNNDKTEELPDIQPQRHPEKHLSFSNLTLLYRRRNSNHKVKNYDILKKHKELQTIIQRGKKIKRQVLNTIISMQSSVFEEEDNIGTEGFDTNVMARQLNYSPQKKPKTALTLLNSAPFQNIEGLLKLSSNNDHTHSSKKNIKDSFQPINTQGSNSLNQKKTKGNTKVINEYRLSLFKENNYRLLMKDQYKVYDSCSDDEEEMAAFFVIHPYSLFLFIWNIIILIATLYYVLIFPFGLAFVQYFGIWMITIELISEIVLIGDIVLHFLIPISSDSKEDYNSNLKDIAVNYIFGWLSFDLIIAFPLCSIINFLFYAKRLTLDTSKGFLLIKLIKIFKILKLFIHFNDKTGQEAPIISTIIPIKMRRLVQFFFFFFIFCHTLACLWIFIGHSTYPNWIVKQNIQDSPVDHIYFSAFYYTLATIYTVGYGDIYPTTIYERLFNIALQTMGLFLYSYAISSMTTILKTSHKTLKFQSQNNLLENVKVSFNVNEKIYLKIRKFLRHSYKMNHEERALFLEELPNPIKNELIFHMYNDLMKFEIFHNTSIDFKTRVILCFKPACSSRGEMIIKRGDCIKDAIFIKRGLLETEYPYKNEIIKLKKFHTGDHFGEVDMLLNKESTFDLVIKSKHAELLLLSKEHLIQIGEDFPSLFNQMRKRSLLQFTLLTIKLKQRIKEIDSLGLRKCEMIIDFNTDNDDNGKGLRKVNAAKKNDKSLNEIDPKNEMIVEKPSSQEESIKDNKPIPNQLSSERLENELCSVPLSSMVSNDKVINTKNKKRWSRYQSMLDPVKDNRSNTPLLSSHQLGNVSFKPHCSPRNSVSFSKSISMFKSSKKSTEDIISQADHISDSMIGGLNSSKGIERKSNKILKNIKESSMNINRPSQFYSQIFDKWTIDNQIKRMTTVWESISSINGNIIKGREKKSCFYLN